MKLWDGGEGPGLWRAGKGFSASVMNFWDYKGKVVCPVHARPAKIPEQRSRIPKVCQLAEPQGGGGSTAGQGGHWAQEGLLKAVFQVSGLITQHFSLLNLQFSNKLTLFFFLK